jgi:hypothetical protein
MSSVAPSEIPSSGGPLQILPYIIPSDTRSEIPTGAPYLSPTFGPTDSPTAASTASHWLAQIALALISAALAFICSKTTYRRVLRER